MRPYAIRVLTLAIYATAAVVPVITATDSEAGSHHGHVRKHHRMSHAPVNRGFTNSWAGREFRPAAPAWGATVDVCPGSGRSFECKVWPPPFDQDPDRKASGADGGP
jgi:hypothetical protein